mmetsp:Transcript_26887/g.107615  ORF Transcript_26887/g.107615 Transcript_26887/m.107615 type:complete len:275 (+) Transcript_26887:623-1447(+)
MLDLVVEPAKDAAPQGAGPVRRRGGLARRPRRGRRRRSVGGFAEPRRVGVRGPRVVVGQDVARVRDVRAEHVRYHTGDRERTAAGTPRERDEPRGEPPAERALPARRRERRGRHEVGHLPQVGPKAEPHGRVVQRLPKVHARHQCDGGDLRRRVQGEVPAFRRGGRLAHERRAVADVGVSFVVARARVVELDVVPVPQPRGPVGDRGPRRGQEPVELGAAGEGVVRRVVELDEAPRDEHEPRERRATRDAEERGPPRQHSDGGVVVVVVKLLAH